MTYPFELPQEAKATLDTLTAVSRLGPQEERPNRPLHRVKITDLISRKVLYFEFREFTETMYLRIPRNFHRKIRVRVYKRFFYRGRVLWISYSPSFSLNISASVISFSGKESSSALNFRFNDHAMRSRKTREPKVVLRMPVGRPVRPSPEEVVGFVPRFRMDGGFYTNQGLDPVRSYFREYTSLRTPDFSRLKLHGRLPINSHSVTMERRFDYGSQHSRVALDDADNSILTFRSYYSQLGGDHGPIPVISHASVQRNKAIERLRVKATGETANLSETFATYNRTFSLIGGTFHRLVDSVRALKKLQIQRAIDILWAQKNARFRKGGGPSRSKDLATNWLELQYGWKPLLSDVAYSIEALGKLVTPDATIGRITSSARSEARTAGLQRPNNVGNPPVLGEWSIVSSTSTRFGLRYRVSEPFRAFAAQSGFTNPVSLAWELLPFSFVVDWAIPIGPYLESLDSWGGLTLLDGYETTFTRMSADYHRHYSGNTYPDGEPHETLLYDLVGRLQTDGIKLDRVKLSNFPSLSFPEFKNPFSTGHALNALALLKVVFGK